MKANAQKRAVEASTVSAPRALRRGLAVAADALWGLGLTADLTSDAVVKADDAIGTLPQDHLLTILDGPDGICGLAAIGPEIVAGLVEVQTLGKVTRLPLDTRAFTQTDAVMMAPLLDAALPRFASMLIGQADAEQFQGYRYGALVDDVATAGLALDKDFYTVFQFQIGLANDTRAGSVHFLFPRRDTPVQNGADQNSDPHGKYEGVLKMVPARMQAVLARIHLPLSKARTLSPGDVLEISADALSSAALVVEGGHVMARGKLGQMNGFRAVRIGDDRTSPRKPDHTARRPESPSGTSDAERTGAGDGVQAIFDDGADLASMDLDAFAAGLPDPAALMEGSET